MFIFINYKCKQQQQHHLSWVFGFGWWLADSVKQGTINASSFCSPAKIYPPTTRLRARGPVGPTNGEEEAVSQPRTLSFPAFILNSCWMGLVPTTTASLLIRIIAYDSWFSHSNFVFFFLGHHLLLVYFNRFKFRKRPRRDWKNIYIYISKLTRD